MPHRPLIVALMLAAAPTAALAQARFTFQPIEGGLMRLDTETGQVSHCTKSGESYACRGVADDRAALQDEIDRLRRENETLRAAAGKPAAPGATSKLQLPTEQDIDKVMSLFETMMRRMMRTFREEAPQGGGAGRL